MKAYRVILIRTSYGELVTYSLFSQKIVIMHSGSGFVLINGSEDILNKTVTLYYYTKILNERLN